MFDHKRIRYRAAAVAVAATTALITACSSSGSPASTTSGNSPSLERSSVSIALTGAGSVTNAPLYIAQKLGYFAKRGLTVKLTALRGGADAIQTLVTGGADATTNEYVHTIAVQQKSKSVEAVTVFEKAPTYAFVLTKGHFNATFKDLPNLKIGVVSLGGATEDLVNYVFVKHGLNPESAKLVSIGVGSTQQTAISSGQVGAALATEPTLTDALDSGQAKLMVDFRNPQVINQVFGGPAPFWSLLVTNDFAKQYPKTVTALVGGCLDALRYIHAHSASEITAQLPANVFYPGGDQARAEFEHILANLRTGFSEDGLMPDGGPNRIKNYLQLAEPKTDLSSIDLSKTFTDQFVEAAHP